MSKVVVKNVNASIRQRLLNFAKSTQRPFNEILQYFVMERFIYRLSISSYKEKFILKGALMFNVLGFSSTRATKDIDLLGITRNDPLNIKNILTEICQIECSEDGVNFISEAMNCERIQEKNEYSGVRVLFFAELAKAKMRVQIDIGFSDIVYPGPVVIEYPTLLNMPVPLIKGYTPETIIAEKLEATLRRGVDNSRMKDIYDIWLLSRQFRFEGKQLSRAIQKTFTKRKMLLPGAGEALIFSESYKRDPTKNRQWMAFTSKNNLQILPGSFSEALDQLEMFVQPILMAQKKQEIFNAVWVPPGSWKF